MQHEAYLDVLHRSVVALATGRPAMQDRLYAAYAAGLCDLRDQDGVNSETKAVVDALVDELRANLITTPNEVVIHPRMAAADLRAWARRLIGAFYVACREHASPKQMS